ncbi:Rho termination factor N-terminal domain-containing protein, partial [Sphaerochaeta sp. S2]|uniref:Rho termination factor N-terminal domain-containing protein n=1 Tax=Sphaerochaeta sp. S2 TaxID=2798868 RepID=UPI0018E98CB0
MDINKLKDKTLLDVKAIAKAMGLKNVSKYNKAQLIDMIIDGNMSVNQEIEENLDVEPVIKDTIKFDLEEDDEKREVLEQN